VPKLSDTKIRAAKPREKPYKLFDSDGLFLSIQPNGRRWWRQRYYLAGTLPRAKVTHHAAITDPAQLGTLLRAIDAYHGGFVVRCGLRLLPHVFVRPGELQWATWLEFDLDGAEWRIPAERMKMREYHIVYEGPADRTRVSTNGINAVE
jgi:integrase